MPQSSPLPCGAWPSPLSPERAAAGAVSLNFAGAAGGSLFWVEGRPSEGGRSVLMRRLPDGEVVEVLGADANVRTRVHEYGGMPWAVAGERLLYTQFTDQRLRMRGADGGVSVITPEGCRYADGAASPEGRRVYFVREDHRAGGEPRNAIVAIDFEAPDEGRLIFGGSDFVAAPRPSADGRRLAFVAWDHPAMPWDETRLVVADLQDGAVTGLRQVAGGAGESVLEPAWDAEGWLYFLSDRSGWWNLYRTDGERLEALTALEAEVGGALWQLGMRSYVLTGDGRALLSVNRGTVESLAWLDLATRALTPIELPFVSFACLGLLDGTTAFALAGAVDAMPALVTIDLPGGRHEVVRSAGNLPLPAAAVSRGRSIEFPTRPGANGRARSAQAWFYPPGLPGFEPKAGEAPPLVVLLHGGPSSQAGCAFKVGVQFWTTRGFAVVDVNYGGSTGFGRAYRERLRGEWGVVDLADAVAAVDHLAAAGLVDGARVAIRGGSAGGFTVLSALAFTQRFAAGINYYGVADLESLAADTHKFEARYLDSLVAPLPEGLEVYRARSPVHHMEACRAALVTFQGSDDHAVPPQQSRAIVEAARKAGCPVAYLEFEGEGHGFRQAKNLVRALEAELVFLGRVFGYEPAGELPPLEIENAERIRPPSTAR